MSNEPPAHATPRQDPPAPSLTVVIPALNEEGAIGGTIQRCLDAADAIKAASGIDHLEWIVVNDGSTDRTEEIARGFDGVRVIAFESNRGYGAAIKEGWRQGSGTLLGFLDADGTCDPLTFGALCRTALDRSADVVLGSRMGPDSKMPAVRRLGNRIYALVLGLLCSHHITDTASGMRVVRRASLDDLYPLPDGLHFTPSMSARALMNNLRVEEVPMSYSERIGESKLSVFRDGVSFLQTIFAGVLCYRPDKVFLTGVALCLLAILVLGMHPLEHFRNTGSLEDWMIYRFAACSVAGLTALSLLYATAVINRMAEFGLARTGRKFKPFIPSLLEGMLNVPAALAVSGAFLAAAVVVMWPGIVEYLTSGKVYMHWSRLLAGAFLLTAMLLTLVFMVIMKTAGIWQDELRHGHHASGVNS